jgi:hypothetical protein
MVHFFAVAEVKKQVQLHTHPSAFICNMCNISFSLVLIIVHLGENCDILSLSPFFLSLVVSVLSTVH